jgi:hypothetical protein
VEVVVQGVTHKLLLDMLVMVVLVVEEDIIQLLLVLL